ncbi:hypothetical protein ABT297_26195 [Dactylosporangium sp. NPDC000555]|uniref:hypothetical protein n=1 Tax=Dactylosporangium sp. NPDC000555 TaxID=3154260 RepID=UPI00332AB61D
MIDELPPRCLDISADMAVALLNGAFTDAIRRHGNVEPVQPTGAVSMEPTSRTFAEATYSAVGMLRLYRVEV